MERIQLPGPKEAKNPKNQSFRELVRALTADEITDISGIPRTKRAMIIQSLIDIAVHGGTVLPFSRAQAVIALAKGEVPQPTVVQVDSNQWLSTVKMLMEFMEGKSPPPEKLAPGEVEETMTASFEHWKQTVQFRRRSAQRVNTPETSGIDVEEYPVWEEEAPSEEIS